MLLIKLLLGLLMFIYSAIGYDTKNKRLLRLKQKFDNKVEIWSGECCKSDVDFVIRSSRKVWICSFFILLIAFCISASFFPSSRLTQIIAYDACAALVICVYGFKTTEEFIEGTNKYINWFFDKGMSLYSFMGAGYFMFMCIWHNITQGVDILDGNHGNLTSLYFGRSFTGITLCVFGIYAIRYLVPYGISWSAASITRIAVSRSYRYKGSTFRHLIRYYAGFWVIVLLVEIIYLSIT